MFAKGQEFCLECQRALTRESSSEPGGAGALGCVDLVLYRGEVIREQNPGPSSSTVVPEGLCQQDRKQSH